MFIPGFLRPEDVSWESPPTLVTGHNFLCRELQVLKNDRTHVRRFQDEFCEQKGQNLTGFVPFVPVHFFAAWMVFSIMRARGTMLTQPIRCVEP